MNFAAWASLLVLEGFTNVWNHPFNNYMGHPSFKLVNPVLIFVQPACPEVLDGADVFDIREAGDDVSFGLQWSLKFSIWIHYRKPQIKNRFKCKNAQLPTLVKVKAIILATA